MSKSINGYKMYGIKIFESPNLNITAKLKSYPFTIHIPKLGPQPMFYRKVHGVHRFAAEQPCSKLNEIEWIFKEKWKTGNDPKLHQKGIFQDNSFQLMYGFSSFG